MYDEHVIISNPLITKIQANLLLEEVMTYAARSMLTLNINISLV